MRPLTPDEIKAWEQVAPPGYRAADQDPRTVFLALYGQDTPPADRTPKAASLRALSAKVGMR